LAVLSNAKHERFAQEIAKGTTATEAYVLAGYAANDSNAARLNGNERISARVAELLERAAAKTEVTVANLTERLLAIAKKGEAGVDAPLLSVGRAAIMDIAKLNGLIIDKQELEHKGELAIARIERRIIDPADRDAEGVQASPGEIEV
jgi:hypothetical protein